MMRTVKVRYDSIQAVTEEMLELAERLLPSDSKKLSGIARTVNVIFIDYEKDIRELENATDNTRKH
jgi:hypothetical protein